MNTDLDDRVAQRISELQADNDRLKKQIAEHQTQKMDAVGQLAAGLAHDVNNILAVIQGNASLLLAGRQPGDKEVKPLETICAATNRASKLVRQLLILSGKQVPELKLTSIRDVLTAAAESLPRELTPQIGLEFSAPSDVPDISADAAMLDSLLVHLAVNARDAMPQGGRLRISVDTVDISADAARANPKARQGRFVRLSVTDSGCGIAPEILPRIFEPFFTTKPVGKGTGLGLAGVYSIVRQHHGWVEVQSRINAGTTFHVFFPAIAAAKQELNHAPSNSRASGAGGETILVVEDEPDLRDLVSQILESSGYKVVAAGSGAEALEAWSKRRADIQLLLTDMMLPDGVNGRILADRFKGENPRLRVIFTSGYSAGMPGTELADVEARHFLAKPYRPAMLLEVVRRCLDEPPQKMAGAAT